MLNINNVQVEFDVTSPEDIRRYARAAAAMTAQMKSLCEDSKDESISAAQYAEHLERQCKILTNFIDDAFGEGTCNKLLCKRTRLYEICTSIATALELHTSELKEKFAGYEPNRKTKNGE